MTNADRLIELFNGAQHLPAGTMRDAYIAEECGDDEGLKEQVRSLLKAHESAGGFLQERLEVSPEIEAKLARFKPEEAGQQIGPYKLREQIGEGGFGTVWVAEQERPVRRTVALKIIKLGMDTEDVIARFGQERQALAMMDHPNIAKIFDAGVTGHGRPFFAMELVEGISITDYCDQANLPTADRIGLFIQVCHAVQHAHQKGIIHRDLKPSNILVTLHDGVAVPKVIDFGVAKATQGGWLAEKTVYTRLQQMIGTPLYMSPEQAEMNGTDVDTRTDIYALGVLLYELLTGRTPFDAAVFLKAGYDEVRRVIREQEPQKPSTALDTMAQAMVTAVAHHRASEPPKLIHAIRGDLDWIVMKSLEKDRARRYDTANGLAMDLQRHLDNEPVIARPPSNLYRFQKLVRRNKLAFAAGTAIAAALVIGFATATWMYFRESDARKRATQAEGLATQRLAEVSAERDAKEVARQEAEAISTFMSEVFQSPDPERDGRTITVAETLDKAATKLETDLADQPARRARLQATLGSTYDALGLPHSAIPLLEKALDYQRTASGPEHVDTLTVMHLLALAYYGHDRLDEAIKLQEEVLALRRKVLGAERSETISGMNNLALFYFAAGRRDEALKLREEVLALRRKVLGPEHRHTLTAMGNLAISYHAAGRRDEAIKLCEELLPLFRRVLGPEHPDTIETMSVLANFIEDAGRVDEARKLHEDVMELSRKVLGPEHWRTLDAMQRLARLHSHVGRHDEAIRLFEEVLPLCRKMRGPVHRNTRNVIACLADSYNAAGRPDEAFKVRDELLALLRKELGADHPDTISMMNELADSYLQAGRGLEALPLLADVSARSPENTQLAVKLAALQVRFAQDADHAATCRRMLQWATNTSVYEAAERVAKLTCLRPIDEVPMREATLALARRAVDLGQGQKSRFLSYAHMVLGMAEYRSDNYPAADEALATAAKMSSGGGVGGPDVVGTASFFHSMSLFKQGRQADARALCTATEATMKPLPADDKNPLGDGKPTADQLIVWLAFKEARALLNDPTAK